MNSKLLALNIAKANDVTIKELGLRFDRVALELLERLNKYSKTSVPSGYLIIVTTTAPIRLSLKTISSIEVKIDKTFSVGPILKPQKLTVLGNKIQIEILKTSQDKIKFIGFVHNPTVSPKLLVNLTKNWLQQKDLL